MTIGLVGLSVSVWLIATAVGLVPDRREAVVEGRVSLSENVAVACSQLATRSDNKAIENHLQSVVRRNPEVLSAAVRKMDGSLTAQVGNHPARWNLPPGGSSTDSQMRVPIVAGNDQWGTVELQFQELTAGGFFMHPVVRLVMFVAAASYLVYFIYLRKMLRHLNPSRVIPPRVRATLDSLVEGLLVLDKDERILLANRSFADSLGATADQLTGRKASELPWHCEDKPAGEESLPWMRAMIDGTRHVGDLLTIDGEHERRILKVGATPILGDDGVKRGALASFDDVTLMEKNRTELREMLAALSQSRDEIHRQNVELERLATRDPLTSCLNRRAFFTELESVWSKAASRKEPIACVMVDLDHFKSVNDTHGHSKGDEVLQKAAKALRSCSRDDDLVCRYGGEEFCVLLPQTDLEGACVIAERIREAIELLEFENLTVTASLGVSARELGARDPQGMIDQADQCLYVAKREGRNRVARFDQAAERIAEFESEIQTHSRGADNASSTQGENAIPFHAVSALVSALAYRDAATADHSRRVADLCVLTGANLMSVSETFVLETAALLHDIGKIGVPDSILLKPGKLSEQEWQVMNSHERIGVEIVQSTFSNDRLAEIIRTYHAWYGGSRRHPQLPQGERIPLEARILAIVDAFDAMTANRTYRPALNRQQAFAELRRCAGKQFDPYVVEQFINVVSSHEEEDVAVEADSMALRLGTQIERLADAMHSEDLEGMTVLARRLRMTAEKYEVEEIAGLAQQLEDATHPDADTKQLVQTLNELLSLHRGAQRAYLERRSDGQAAATMPAASSA